MNSGMLAYWSSLSQHKLGTDSRVLALCNSDLPVVEVNAGYPESLDDVFLIEDFFNRLGRPLWLMLPEDSEIELGSLGYTNQGQIQEIFVQTHASVPEILVEHVPWSEASLIAKIICDSNTMPDWSGHVAFVLAKCLQKNFSGFVAYKNNLPVGALVMNEDGHAHFWNATEAGFLAGAAKAMFGRAAEFFAGKVWVGIHPNQKTRLGEMLAGAALGPCWSVWQK